MHLVRANALHERNHGGEDHPVPCRTRQLSSPSPKVLRCSPWEDRPFRSCRAFPLSRALRALFCLGPWAPSPPGPLPSGVRRGRAACRLPDLLASGPSRRFGSLSRSQIAPLSREPSLLVSSLKHILSRFLCASLSPVSLVLTKGLSLLCNLRVRQFWDSGFLLVIRVVSALV